MLTVARNEYRGTFDTPKSGLGRQIALAARVREALDELGPGHPDAPIFARPSSRSGAQPEALTEKAMTLQLIAAGARAGLKAALDHRARMRECRRAAKLRKAGKPLSEAQAARVAAYEAGTAVRFGWHLLRHSFCSHLAMQGTPAIRIMKWAGHAHIATTQRYMHLAPTERGAAAALDALDRSAPAAILRSVA